MKRPPVLGRRSRRALSLVVLAAVGGGAAVSWAGVRGAAAPTLGGGGGGPPAEGPGPAGARVAARVRGPAAPSAAGAQEGTPGRDDPPGLIRPGPVQPDLFHPDNQPGPDGERPPAPQPRRGGRVVVHLGAGPGSWNRTVDNSAVVGVVHAAVHESLLERDLETWEYRSVLAQEWVVEDRVVLGGEGAGSEVLYGKVEERGNEVVVRPAAPGNPLDAPRTVSPAEVRSLERDVAYTFRLRDDVTWHDGHPFDAADVRFSWQLYWNPTVDCDHDRDEVQAFVQAEVLGPHTVRFVGGEQYFAYPLALANLCLLPRHLYDLSDPDNEAHEPGVDVLGERAGTFVNQNPHNRAFVGLGPYRLTEVADDHVDAVRYGGYFEPDPAAGLAGWLDGVRWRIVADRGAARTAMLEGELDYCELLSSSDYFGAFTHQEAFTDELYAGYAYRPQMQYVAWNMRRPHLADVRVRRALAHAADWEAFLEGQANGLGVRITGTSYHAHPSYDHSLEPLPFDPGRAEELLDEAGWYDRDGDGVRDKDGRPLRIEFLSSGGVSALYARILQEGLARIGVGFDVVTLDAATLYERIRSKDFDAVARAWFLDPENDPIQVWGRWNGDPAEDRSTNFPGWGDAASDALIARIRRTVDDEERWRLTRRLQRRIFEEQPYLFLFDFPAKFAVAKRIRGFKAYGLQPGYSLRDWYVVDD